MNKVILMCLCMIIGTTGVFSQEFALDKGSLLITGTGSFSTSGGDLYKSADNKRLNSIAVIPSVNYFIYPNVFAGLGFAYDRTSQGDASATTIGVGPRVGYVNGDKDSKVLPFFDWGVDYNSSKIDDQTISGLSVVIGGGVIVLGSENMGLVVEATWNVAEMKAKDADSPETGNAVTIGIGIAGFIF